MVQGKNRISYWIDRRLPGLAGPEYHAIISFGLPIEPEDSQYGESRLRSTVRLVSAIMEQTGPADIKVWVDDEEQLPDWGREALQGFLVTGQGFEKNRLISELDTVDNLLTSRLGYDEA